MTTTPAAPHPQGASMTPDHTTDPAVIRNSWDDDAEQAKRKVERTADLALRSAGLRAERDAAVADLAVLRAKVARLTEQLQHECPHREMSWSGVDQTPLEDPAKVWACDNCGKHLDAEETRR